MPSQAAVLLLLSIFAFQALGERPLPVDPAYAADQPKMTAEAMACTLVDRQIESLRNQIAAAKQTLKGLELSKARVDREADVVPVGWNK